MRRATHGAFWPSAQGQPQTPGLLLLPRRIHEKIKLLMRSVTHVEPKLLKLLSPDEAVKVLRQLLWAEAAAVGLGPGQVSVPSAIYDPDGGIDAEVSDIPTTATGGLLFPGFTRYQVKTGSFTAGNDADRKDLFLKANGKEFKERVRTCFEKDGMFVAFLFGDDAVDRTDEQTLTACCQFIRNREPKFENCRIKIVRQDQIAGFIDRHLAIALGVQMKEFPHLRTHAQWAGELESNISLKLGPQQAAFLEQVRSELRQGIAKQICILGRAGGWKDAPTVRSDGY